MPGLNLTKCKCNFNFLLKKEAKLKSKQISMNKQGSLVTHFC